MSVAILGGGLAGLSFAHFLREQCSIYESSNVTGGLMRSDPLYGIPLDIGPHILFSKDQDALLFLTRMTKCKSHARKNSIWFYDRFVEYPFENYIGQLRPSDLALCVTSFLNRKERTGKETTMEQFFQHTFGSWMTENFFRPLNEKIWKAPLSELDTQMVARIPQPTPAEIMDAELGKYHTGYTHQAKFYYPEEGGIHSVFIGLNKNTPNVDLHTKSAYRLGWTGTKWQITDGNSKREYDYLVSTIPLDDIVSMVEDALGEVCPGFLSKLHPLYNIRHRSLLTIDVVVRQHGLGEFFAVQCPDPRIPFHRVTNVSYYGGSYDKTGRKILSAEITTDPSAESDLSLIAYKTISAMAENGWIKTGDIMHVSHRIARRAYVLYNLYHRKSVDAILKWLKSKGIICVGRWGKHEYLNMDQIVKQSLEAVDELTGRTNPWTI